MPQLPDEVIAAEVAALRAVKPNVRPRNMFDDDNHRAIDAQVEVLEQRLTEAQIFERWGGSGADEDAGDDYVLNEALAALHWMQGQSEGKLSEEWAQVK